MKKITVLLLLILSGYNFAHGQEIQKKLQIEEDGFQWYLLMADDYEAAQDRNGKELIPFSRKYKYITYITDFKLFQIMDIEEDFIYGYCGIDGKELIPLRKYDNALYRNEKDMPIHFEVKKDNLWGVCDKDGKEVIPIQYDKIIHSIGNYFIVSKGGFEGLCDMSGKFTIPLSNEFTLLLYKKETDSYIIHKGDHLQGVCKADGSYLIPLSRGYEQCFYEEEGWYEIMKDGYFGVCDLTGKEVVQPNKYKSSFSYDENKGVYTYDENWNVVTLYKPRNNTKSISSNNYANNSISTSNVVGSAEIKKLYDLAYNTPDSEGQTKYNRYMQVIQADPYNSYGYKAFAYNNLGVLYETLGDFNNAKKCYESAIDSNPNYDRAKQNLKRVKNQLRSNRLNKFSNALGAIGQAFGSMGGSQTTETYNTFQGDGSSFDSSTSSGYSSTSGGNCVSCGGSGKCSAQGWADKYRCHGSGACQHCNNTGTQTDFGNTRLCSTCHGSKKCHYCEGSGKCPTCRGTGKR